MVFLVLRRGILFAALDAFDPSLSPFLLVEINVPLSLRPFRSGRFALLTLVQKRKGMKCLQGSLLADEPADDLFQP